MRSGNSAARWAHRVQSRTTMRRAGTIIRDEAKDLGNRPGVAEAFGFGDPRAWDGTPERFRYLAHRWMQR